MYPHDSNFETRIRDYIDFTEYDKLVKEAQRMKGLGMAVFMDGVEAAFDISDYIDEHPEATDDEVCSIFKCAPEIVEKIRDRKNNLTTVC